MGCGRIGSAGRDAVREDAVPPYGAARSPVDGVHAIPIGAALPQALPWCE
jgi:hypothetical protein